jgi:undecaprenyl-phosphate 4-deoxy-4-formamido-L-arabinose transferase
MNELTKEIVANRRPTISVIIPVYNSAAILPKLIAQLVPILDHIASAHEILLVNDGSNDTSWDSVALIASTNEHVRGINLMRNFGQHNAILCGLREARYEITMTMDDDLEHPPGELHKLLEKLDKEFDVVYGAPQTQQHGLWRDLASQITKMTLRGAMGVESARNVSALRAFRTNLREGFASYGGSFVSIDVLLSWSTTRFASIKVNHNPRLEGASNYTFRKLCTHAMNMTTGFSSLPLQLASWIGFAFTAFGIIILFFVVGRFILEGSTVPGFAFLASLIAIFSGAQLFALGIIGEYLARMHFRLMDRPAYTIRSTTFSENKKS